MGFYLTNGSRYGTIFTMKNNQITISSLPQPVLVSSLHAAGLDAFDSSDAFFTCGEFADGTTMSEEQLDILTDSSIGSIRLHNMSCAHWSEKTQAFFANN